MQQARFGNFELDPRRLAARGAHDLGNALSQIVAIKLPPGKIDRDDKRQPGFAPHRALLGCRAQDPVAENVNQARLLGERNENLRRNFAVLRIVPTQQRLGADDRLVGDADDRLIVKHELVFLDRNAECLFQRVLIEPPRGEIGVEKLIGVAAKLLGAVHRHVGVLEQAFRIVAVVGINRDADRRRHIDLVLLDLERLSDGFLKLLRDAIEHRGVVEILDDDHELVASEPRQQVGCAQGLRQGGGDAFEQLVADAMSQSVVDVFETVEIDEHYADPSAAALGLCDRLREPLLQQQSVRQSRQRIACRQILQALFRLDARRHVLDEGQDRYDASLFVEQTRVIPLAPDRLTVLAIVSTENRRARLVARHEPVHSIDDLLVICLVRELTAADRNAVHFIGAPAEDLLRLWRPADEKKVGVPLQHRQRCVVDVRGKHPVGAVQRFLVALLVVNVGMRRIDADDVSLGIAIRRKVYRFPAQLAVGLNKEQLIGNGFAGKNSRQQRLQLPRPRVAQNLGHRSAGELLAAFGKPFLVVPVQEPIAVFAIDVSHARRHVVHDEPQLGLARAQRLLRLLQAMDVVHQHECAVHLARRRRVGHHPNGHPALRASCSRNQTIERGRFAVQRT